MRPACPSCDLPHSVWRWQRRLELDPLEYARRTVSSEWLGLLDRQATRLQVLLVSGFSIRVMRASGKGVYEV
jgi:hypothetical protein